MATLKPWSTSPRTWSAGTGTPSKTSRPIGCGESSESGSPLRPSLARGTANAVRPRSLVRAKTE